MLHEKHRLRRYKTVSYELWITLNNIYPNQTAVELVYDSLSRSVSKKSESVSPDSIWKQFVSPPSANCFCCSRSNNRALIRDLLGIRAEVVISVNREKITKSDRFRTKTLDHLTRWLSRSVPIDHHHDHTFYFWVFRISVQTDLLHQNQLNSIS